MTGAAAVTATVSACPICGAQSFGVLGERSDGIVVLQCERCRMGVVAEHPLDTAAYYSDAYYWNDEASESGYSAYHMVAAHSLPWVSELVGLLRADGKVLDVGCADGYLLQLLGRPYELYGIEVNERLFQQCRRAGIRMLGRDISEARLVAEHGSSFDVITAIAVLEHVADIHRALEQIRALLAPEGVLIFEVPLISPTRDNSVWFTSSLEHIYYPTLEGLSFLFEAVFALPLVGREVAIKGYGSTFVGLATRSATKHRELTELLQHLLDTPIAALESRSERSFRFFFDLVHAAAPTAENVALLAELEPQKVTRELLHRVATLWGLELSRAAAEAAMERTALAEQLARHEKALHELTERYAHLSEMQAALAQLRAHNANLKLEVEKRDASLDQVQEALAEQLARLESMLGEVAEGGS